MYVSALTAGAEIRCTRSERFRISRRNNPLTDELKEQILSIEGVEKVEESFFAGALITNIEELKEDDGAPLDSGISGVSDELIEECNLCTRY